MTALTDRQREIVTFIRDYLAEHGHSPSVREIRDAIGVASTSTVHLDLVAIKAAGVIHRPNGLSRAIVVLDDAVAA